KKFPPLTLTVAKPTAISCSIPSIGPNLECFFDHFTCFGKPLEKCGLAFHGWIGSVGQEKLLRDFGRAGGSSRVGRIAMRRGALERKFATEPMRIVLEAGTHSGWGAGC
ncbi:MAG TPA: hypothetical protein VKZ59_14675, partial [Acidobacteriota bacterium]|nr:hypothetical protein [Acidobacteriota bacterium]